MKADDVVRMANQIADHFKPYPEEEALQGVIGHIGTFWEPRMRTKLAELGDEDVARLAPLAVAARAEYLAE